MERVTMIKRITHITIRVSNLKKSVSFFENVLGLKKKSEYATYVDFDVGGVDLGLEQKGKPHIYFLVDNVDKAYQNLKDKGVKFVTEPKDQYWGGRTAMFLDPDENIFLLIQPFTPKHTRTPSQ